MAAPIRFLSGRQQQQKIGVIDSTENSKVLEVVGRAGIGTTIFEPSVELDVRGSISVSGVSTLTGQVSFGNTVTFGDNDQIIMGDNNDLQIYHDGDNSYVEDTGTQALILKGSTVRFRSSDNQNMISASKNGSVDLYYMTFGQVSSKKFETTGYGVTVLGITQTQQLNVSGISTFNNDVTFVGALYNASWDKSGDKLKFADNAKATFGAGDDLQIFHDGSNNYIQGVNGNLILKNNTADYFVGNNSSGSVELNHNGSKKFETTGIGVSVSNGAASTATIAAPANLIIDPAVVGDNTGLVRIKGDLFVDGTTTQINSTTLEIADFVVGIASTATSDLLTDGAGIKIGPDNTFLYEFNGGNNPSLKSSENLNVASGKVYQIDQTERLSADTLSLGTGTTIHSPASNTLTLGTNETEKVRITSAGDVGIGSTQPTAKLDVDGTLNVNGQTSIGASLTVGTNPLDGSPGLKLRGNVGHFVTRRDGAKAPVYSVYDGELFLANIKIQFENDGSAFFMNSVGIGITGPETKLHVHDGDIRVTNAATTNVVGLTTDGNIEIKRTGGGAFIDFADSAAQDHDARIQHNNGLDFYTGIHGDSNNPPQIRFSVDNIGNVGIGTSIPNSAKLDVKGTIRHTGVTTMVPGAFDVNSIVGERPLQVNYKLLSTSLRTGFLVKNAFDFRTDNTFNSAFMVLDPYDTSNSTFAFRVAVGATLSDTAWIKTDGDGYFSGNIGIGTSIPSAKLHLVDDTSANIYLETKNSDIGSTAGIYFRTSDSSTEDVFFKTAIVLEDDGTSFARGKLHILQENTADDSNATLSDSVVTIDQSGKVGIHSTSPETGLDIRSNDGIFVRTSTNNPTNGARIQFSDQTGSSTQRGHIKYKHSDNTVSPGSNDGFLIGGTENLTVVKVEGRALIDEKVGIGTDNPTAKLAINPLTTLSTSGDIGGVSINNLENKTYPTTSGFFVGLGLNQDIEVGGTQVINPSTPGGYNFISGIRNILTKDNDNTQDIERSHYYGMEQRFSWNDQNTCKQYISIFDSFVYAGIDTNGRTSSNFDADRLIFLPPEGGQQTVATVNSKIVQLRGNGAAGISTVAITDATGYAPSLTFMNFATGTHNNSITNYSAFGTKQWGTQGSTGTLNATITNYYGLRLSAPISSTGLTITNNYGVYSGWSESKNYFAGNVGIGTDNPTTKLTINPLTTLPVDGTESPTNPRQKANGGVSIANSENKIYPSSNFNATLGLYQENEIGGITTYASGNEFIYGSRNVLVKRNDNTQDIKALNFTGSQTKIVWTDQNTAQQIIGDSSTIEYLGADANGRTSSYLIADNIFLRPADGATQTINNVVSSNSVIINPKAGINTVNITSLLGVRPAIPYVFNANSGTHDVNITNLVVYDTGSDWGTIGSAGTVTVDIDNYYGLRLLAPTDSASDLTFNNNFGVYSGWSESKNYFAGDVGIGTSNPTEKLDVNGNIMVGVNPTIDSVSNDSGHLISSSGQILTRRDGQVAPVYSVHANAFGEVYYNYPDDIRIQFKNDGSAFFMDNVGIGTTNPQTRLEVYSTSSSDLSEREIRINASNVPTGGNSSGLFRILGNGNSAGKYLIGYNNNHTSQPNQLSLKNADGDITFFTANNSTPTEKVRITSAGDVGIGTDNPDSVVSNNNSSILHVGIITARKIFGDANITGTIDSARNVEINDDTTNSGTHYIHFGDETAGNDQVEIDSNGLVYKNGSVGIGTDNPTSKLNVYNGTPSNTGGILVQNVLYGNNQDKPYLIAGTKGWTGATTNWNTFGFQHRIKSDGSGVGRVTIDTAGGEAFCVENGGKVGINSTVPTEKLDVIGTVKATDFNTTSDQNLKTNVRTIENSIEKITEIRGVNFEWKDGNKPSAGVIAQEVEKVLPELIGGEETKTVNYNGLIGLLIEVVKEQQTQINSLNQRLSKLE